MEDMPKIRSNLAGIKKKFLDKDNDYLFTIVGREGSGKSSLGIKICRTIDPKFSADQICFSGLHFINAILKAKPKTAVLWDEAGEGGYSRDSMKKMNNLVNKALMYSRAKQLFIVVIIPNFFMLDKYLRISRVGMMAYIIKRGEAFLYSNKQKNKNFPSAIVQLTIKGQKTYNMSCVRPDGVDQFRKLGNLFSDWGEDGIKYKEYYKKKTDFINKFLEDSKKELQGTKENQLHSYELRLYKTWKWLHYTLGHKWEDIARMTEEKEITIKKHFYRLRDRIEAN